MYFLRGPLKYIMRLKKIVKICFILLVAFCSIVVLFIASFGGLGRKTNTIHYSNSKDSILFFSHRGLANYYPENSLEAVEGARKIGLNAVEIDILRSKEHEFIVFHDENTLRLLGIDKEVKNLDTTQLRSYPLIFKDNTSTSHVSTVEEMLNRQKEDMIFYFDMKLSSFKDADEIARLVKEKNSIGSVIVASSDILFVFYMEYYHPEIITALEGFNAGKEWTYDFIPKNLKPDYLSGFSANADANHVEWLKKNDLMDSKIVYGVDTSNVDEALKAGFKNIIIEYDSVMSNVSLNNEEELLE